jgi:hypothetical protein
MIVVLMSSTGEPMNVRTIFRYLAVLAIENILLPAAFLKTAPVINNETT